ncbi:MAG: uroporphyrinogen-III synthase [Cypionkella sp.]
MSRPLVVVRPEPGCSETVRAAQAQGLAAVAAPLFSIEPVAWQAPDPARFDGILAGSANVFRLGGKELARLAALPVHAVGERTAAAARAAGFVVETVGGGGLQAVIEALAPPRRLMRLAGAARVPLAPPPGVGIAECVVYRAVPLALDGSVLSALRAGAVVALHSGEAARAFAALCGGLGLARERIALAALAPRIAAAAGGGWAAVAVAPEVSDAALLATARDMCQ